LLLRSAEGKPPSTRFVFETLHFPLTVRGQRRDIVVSMTWL